MIRNTVLVAIAVGGLGAQEYVGKPVELSQKPKIAHGPMEYKPLPFFSKGPFGDKFGLSFQTRDRALEQAEREYERGTRALDKKLWEQAVQHFGEVITTGRGKVDAALYWKAYALAKLGRTAEASAALNELSKSHAQSRWLNDAKALNVEIARAAGKPLSPEDETDSDIKLMAINALMQSDPERSVPLLEKLLQTSTSPRLRERALFILSQNDSPGAREIVARAAKGEFNPDLQMKAVQSLGAFGGGRNRQLLSEIYASSNDVSLKRQILQSFMMSGDRETVLKAAKSETSPELRRQAIQLLGAMGAGSHLDELYASESSVENKAYILQAMIATGNASKLIAIAKTEKEPRLRQRAIQQLGTMNSPQVSEALLSIYSAEQDPEVRARVLQALFMQGNAKQLIDIARKESDPKLKRTAVQHLSHMKSKEATDYMLELLK